MYLSVFVLCFFLPHRPQMHRWQMAASGPAHLSLIYLRSPLLSTPQRVDDIDLLCYGAAADDDNKMVMADVFPFEDERPGAGGGMTRGHGPHRRCCPSDVPPP